MACSAAMSLVQRRLAALSSSETQLEWYTDWMPAIGLDNVQGVLKNKAVTGNFESRMAMQTAAIRTDNPDSPILLESSYQASGERCSSVLSIATDLLSKCFVRFGVGYHLSSGSTPGQSDTSLELAYNSCGRIIGGDVAQLYVPGTTSFYRAFTGWIPAAHAAKVKAAIVILNASANFRCQLAQRTATTSRESTSAWSSALEGGWHSGNGEYNTGEVSLSNGSSFWVQFGLEYQLSSGSSGEATASVSVAVRAS